MYWGIKICNGWLMSKWRCAVLYIHVKCIIPNSETVYIIIVKFYWLFSHYDFTIIVYVRVWYA